MDVVVVYLPRVKVRIATVSRMPHPRYRCLRISVGLRRLDTLGIGGVGASDSRGSDPVSHVDNHVVPRLRYHIRI